VEQDTTHGQASRTADVAGAALGAPDPQLPAVGGGGTRTLPAEPVGPAHAAPPAGRGFFVRRVQAASQFEIFFVSAVGTILIVRAALALTGWPQLGGGKIHFAHLLWGGLGMLIGIILFIALQGRLWSFLATLACGIGFGLFIDELGKFITSDNDYFFKPTIAIIYLIFVGLFFLFHWLGSVRSISQQAALVNAFDFAKEAVLRNMDEGERAEALYLLSRADQRDPMVVSLTDTLRSYTDLVAPLPTPIQRAGAWLARAYDGLLRRRAFKVVVVGWFLIISLAGLAAFVIGTFANTDFTFAELGLAFSSAISGSLVIVGVTRFRRKRISAYRWFERAVLVSIFVGCFFSFYEQQLGALWDLVFLLITYATIRYIIGQELKRQAGEHTAAHTAGGDRGTAQMFAEGSH
jgi:hypothetical protein